MTINRNLSLLTPNVSASGAVNNAGLTNSSVTIGSTAVSLGATVTTFAGLTSVTSTSFVGALTGNASTATSAATWTTPRNLAGNSVDGSAAVAFANKFIVQGTTDTGLTGAQFLGALGTGIIKNTTTTGVLSIAVAGDFPTLNQNTTGSAGSVTNTLTIGTGLSGTSFNGSAAVTVALATGYGDTQNPYASKTANFFLAAPNGAAGAPTFRAIVSADIPTLNQNTTGSAGSVTNTLTIGTGLSGTSFNGSAAVTVAIDSTVATLTGAQTLTNKTLTFPVIDNIKLGYTTTATAASTTTLTATSNHYQRFTGSTTQTVVLPVTSTLVVGVTYAIENASTGDLTVNSSGGNLVITIIPGVSVQCMCIGTSLTTAADWDPEYNEFATITGTGAVVLGTAPTISALTLTGTLTAGGGVGTNGQVLQSTVTGVQWATVSGGSGGITTGKSIAMAIVFGG